MYTMFRLSFTMLTVAAITAPHIWGQDPPRAVRTNPGFAANVIARGDRGASPEVDLGFTFNYFGTQRSRVFVNIDGNVSFGQNAAYANSSLRGITPPMIAPFWADVSTTEAGSGQVTWGRDTVDGRPAFGANYINVGASGMPGVRNSFQVVIIDRSDTGAGNADVEFNYDSIQWECGLFGQVCQNGRIVNSTGPAVAARAGMSSGTVATSFMIDGSFAPGSFLDGAVNPLARRSMNSAVPGRLVFRIRDGQVIDGVIPKPRSAVHAASFGPQFTPSAYFTIYGDGFTTSTLLWDNFIPDGRTLPRQLGGVRVQIGQQQDCYVYFVSPGQINVLAPPGNYSGVQTVTVITENESRTLTANVAPVAPGFFSYVLNGRSYPATLFAGTGTLVASPAAVPGARAARGGDLLSFFATGLGATASPVPAGQVLTQVLNIDNLSRVRITIDGLPAEVLFAGMTFTGVFQINVRAPANLRAGDLPVVLEVSGIRAPQESVLTFTQ
jgi:uncharacterized protein (TIGR03437 family)